ncbi:MAG: secretin N-terminal domain-containing protein [Verrucomicrobiota bacterium]
MKIRCVLTLAVAVTMVRLLILAQEQDQPAKPPAAAPAAAQPATDIPPIVIEDAALLDVIRFLAEQSNLKVRIDPQIMEGRKGPDGSLVPHPNVNLNLRNVTAEQALNDLLKDHKLVLQREPNSDEALLTEAPAAPPVVATVPDPAAGNISTNAVAPGDEVLPVLPIGQMQLQEVITLLAESAKVDFLFDPKLIASTNNVLTNDFPATKFYNKSYKQALEAILLNNDLVLIADTNTQIARISRKPPPELEPLLMQVVQLKYSSTTNMTNMIMATLPDKSRTRVTADNRTSQLVVVATAKDLEAITNLVSQLDTPTKQVLIEARLMETSKNPRSIKGIDWSGTVGAQSVTFGNGRTVGETVTTIPGETTTRTLPSGRTINVTSPRSERTTLSTLLGNAGLSLDTARGFHPGTAFLNADGVRAVLSFLESDSDTEIIATPRAVTLDNETARLEVSKLFPIFEVTPPSQNQPATAKISYTNLGTILLVTPRIGADDNIALKVEPEVSNIDSVDRQILNGNENTANIYAVRRVVTRVTIPSGNTLVMGGLISDSITRSQTKVPVLGDIPGLGHAFRRDSKVRSKSNLMIFVTPTIVEDYDFQPSNSADFLQQRSKETLDEPKPPPAPPPPPPEGTTTRPAVEKRGKHQD